MLLRLRLIRVYWRVLIAILIVAAGLRLLSYDFSLPYIDQADEPVFYQQGRAWRGEFAVNNQLDYYPPGYVTVNAVAQLATDTLGITSVADVIRILRLIAVGVNLLTLLLIAQIARLTAGDVAAWVAAAAWGFSPLVLENGVYATPDPFVYFLAALAFWMAAVAWLDNTRRGWCVWSVIAGGLAILTKHAVFPVVVPGLLVAIAIAIRDRERGLRYLALQVVVIAGLALYLLKIYPVSAALSGDQIAREFGLTGILDIGRALNNLHQALIPLPAFAFSILAVLGIVAFFYARRHGLSRVRAEVVLAAALLLAMIPWLATADHMPDVLPATVLACVLLGAAVAQVLFVIAEHAMRPAAIILPVVIMGGLFLPQVIGSWTLVTERRLPDSRVALRHWFDINLESGGIVVSSANSQTFNPIRGGIESPNWVEWQVSDDIMQYSIEAWRDQGLMDYAAIAHEQAEAMRATESGQAYLAGLLHLRDFVPPPAQRGPAFEVYRLWRMQQARDLQFGESIHLLGFDQSALQVAPGEDFHLRFYWNATATPSSDVVMFVQLSPLPSQGIITEVEGAPARPERPAPTWDAPDETLISQPFTLTIPAATPPGEYRITIGLYDATTGQRLPIVSAESGALLGDNVELLRIIIVAPENDV